MVSTKMVAPGGVRATRQAGVVESVLASSSAFRSAQDIHAELRSRGERIGLATVYRHLQALAENGALDVLRIGGGETTYRSCDSARHHHHLVCRRCGFTVEVTAKTVETWSQRVAAENGFADPEHLLEIFGVCADCQQSEED